MMGDGDGFDGRIVWGGDGSPVGLLLPPPDEDGVFPPPPEVDWPTGTPLRDAAVDEEPAQTMVALRVPSDVASRYGREAVLEFDLVPLQDRHITLAYLGELRGAERQRLHSVVRRWLAESEWPSLAGQISGWGTFAVPHGGGGPVLWMGWNVPGLGELRDDLREVLIGEGFTCVDPVEYVPHETVGYATGDTIRDLPVFPDEVLGCVFDGVVVAEDDAWTEYGFAVGGHGDGGLLCASGRPAVVAALMAAAEEHEAALAGVLDGGFTVGVADGLSGAVVAGGSSVDGFEVFAVGGDGDGVPVLVEGDGLWLPGALVADGSVVLPDAVVVAARSRDGVLGLPLTMFRGGDEAVFLQDRAGKRLPLRASTSVAAVARFLRGDGAGGSVRRMDDGALLGSVALWSSNHTPVLVAASAPVPELGLLRSALAVEGGDWAALVAAGRRKGGRGNAARLKKYWLTGKGAAKIRWNTKGDWKRCVKHLRKHMGPRAKGYCFTGDTEFLTRDGVMTFADAVGTRQFVLTSRFELGHRTIDGPKRDGYWVEAPISSFGEQPVLSVTLRRGGVDKVVRATPEHRWLASPNGRNIRRCDLYKVTTAELQPGMVLASLLAERDDDLHLSPDGIRAGIVFGDGYKTSKNRSSVFLWGEKQDDLLDYFDGYRKGVQKELATGVLGTEVLSLPGVYKDAPSVDADKDYLYGWLAGYFAADGSVSRGGKSAPVLTSASREDIERAKHVATLLGIGTGSITSVMRVGYGSEESELFRMTFARWSLTPEFFLRRAHRENFGAATGKTSGRWTVVSVEDLGEVEEVFCATVPETEIFTLTDNIASFNCTNLHKIATGEHTGSMSHRIKFGWGGKPGSYWAARAAKKGMKASAAVDMLAVTGHGEGAVMGDIVDGVPADGDPLVMFMEEPKQQRFRIPLLLPEDVESGDGRTFEGGSVEVRELPIPLLWQPNSMQGHDGAMIVGRIDHVERTEGGIGNCTGVFDTSPVALEAVRMIRDGFLRGVSADLDKFEAKVLGKGGGTAEAGKKKSGKKRSGDDDVVAPDRLSINQGRVMAATLVAKPAFEQAAIELEDDPVDEVAVAASARPEDGVLRGRLEDRLWWELRSWSARQERSAGALLASGGVQVPVTPPGAWFDDPGLDRPTHLTITDEGRVFGHIAAWHVDHIGLGFGTRPPKSKSGYAYFRTGALRTAEGEDVRVGQLTLSGGHAPLQADARDAVKHYDDTASAFADVAVGEDRHGIWVAGALRPDVSEAQLRAARAASPSGDWRPINGRLELVAVCQVNVPGFPVVEARVASGAVVALVAAGTAPLLEDMVADRSGELQAAALAARARMLRARVGLPSVGVVSEPVAAAEAVVPAEAAVDGGLVFEGQRLTIREAAELLFAMRDREAAAESVDAGAMADALTAAGSGESMPDGSFLIRGERDLRRAVESFGACAESDRRRVRNHIRRRAAALGLVDMLPSWWVTPAMKVGGDGAAVSSVSVDDAAVLSKQPVSTERRKKMAEEHTALPDGSYPIADTEDLKRAIHAYGRSKPSDRKKVRDHIKKRARALGHPELIPGSWSEAAVDAVTADGGVDGADVLSKQPVSAERREKMAEEHTALPDGSYPIADTEDLRRAIRAYGRSKPADRKKVRDHIKKRARALGHPELIPDSWSESSAVGVAASGAPLSAAEVAAARLRGLRVS